MKKTTLSSAIAICLGMSAQSVQALDVPITNMFFDPGNYAAEGTLMDNTVAPGDLGAMQSVDDFFSNPWGAVGVAYFEAGNATPISDDDTTLEAAKITNGSSTSFGAITQSATGDGTDFIWSGTAAAGAFTYNFTLPANHVAWGTLFNWNVTEGIPVLAILDCTDPANCAGIGTPMATPPFAGAAPAFSGGLPAMACADSFVSIAINEVHTVEKTTLTSTCVNANGPVTIIATDLTTTQGAVGDNGTSYTYTPLTDFQGPDSFGYTMTDGIFTTNASYLIQIGGELQSNFSMLDKTGNVFGGTNDVDIVWDEVTYNTNALDAKGIPTDTTFGIMTIASPQPFFNFNWTAHNVRVFTNNTLNPITYKFDVTCEGSDYDAGTVDCNKPLADQGATQQYMTMTLQPGEEGAHILFDWGKNDAGKTCGVANCDIDVVNVWKKDEMWDDHGDVAPKNALWLGPAGVTPATDANWRLVSYDFNGDGNNASPMIDGAFVGSYANFNYKPDKVGAAQPPYTGQIDSVGIDSFSINPLVSLGGLLGIFGLRRLTRKK